MLKSVQTLQFGTNGPSMAFDHDNDLVISTNTRFVWRTSLHNKIILENLKAFGAESHQVHSLSKVVSSAVPLPLGCLCGSFLAGHCTTQN